MLTSRAAALALFATALVRADTPDTLVHANGTLLVEPGETTWLDVRLRITGLGTHPDPLRFVLRIELEGELDPDEALLWAVYDLDEHQVLSQHVAEPDPDGLVASDLALDLPCADDPERCLDWRSLLLTLEAQSDRPVLARWSVAIDVYDASSACTGASTPQALLELVQP